MKPVSNAILRKMNDVIAHRGPDGEGFWINDNIGLAHRRLAIIDLSPSAQQPMLSRDGRFVLTYNGEVYNFLEIKAELESLGHQFHTKSDSEVILNSYAEWGKDCLYKFNGMFAFAVWDNLEKKLFLARDRYGIKPLYYFNNKNTFLFGSEIKSILEHPEYKTDVSIPALNEYFSFQNIFSDLTLFKGIKLLPNASYMILSVGTEQVIEKYWDYDFRDELKESEDEIAEELARLFEKAVNRQLISDVEIGAYLSGGLDSGSITCIASKNFKNLKTFTCGFDLSSASGLELGFDERKRAEELSYLNKTEHYEVVLKAGDMERILEDLIWHIEDLRVGQCYPNYYVARLASKFVKVVLSGSGGDELFAGYPWRYFAAMNSEGFDEYSDNYYRYWQRLISDSEKPKFYVPEIYPEIWNYQTKDIFKTTLKKNGNIPETPSDYINNSLYFEIKTFLQGLLLIEDKISMAHSLETRVPFLDNDFVNFAMKIPVNMKLRNPYSKIRLNENEPFSKRDKYFEQTHDGKIILRRVLKNYVPAKFYNNGKQGFSAPDASWFKGESIDYIKLLLSKNNARVYDYLQYNYVKKLLNEHFSGKVNRRLLIWSLLNFEWWLKIFMK